MSAYLLKLDFRGPVHIGADEAAIGVERTIPYIHSDTLFSAICNGWARLFPKDDLEECLGKFKLGNPPFRISSTFFYKSEFYYLPRPLTDPADFCGEKGHDTWLKYHKKLKRTSFINPDAFLNWVSGKPVLEKMLPDEFFPESIYYEQVIPHVVLDRVSSQPHLYYASQVRFLNCCGLCFFLQLDENNSYKSKLEAVLEYLGDVGLGGEKSVGCGQFKLDGGWMPVETHPRWGEIWRALSNIQQPDAYYLLSLFCPGDKDKLTKDGLSAYQLVPRRGWTFSSVTNSSYKRDSMWMLGEGSVLGGDKPLGDLVDVTPKDEEGILTGHLVYKYGYAFSLPIKTLS